MAAEVPAKDVLCEATEYLCKLGTNLRKQTENLKQKRIRKDKLNNVLALEKAARKVLLICELSKKSLQNVEIGIQKVLQNVEISQSNSTNNGGKSSNKSEERPDMSKYHHIEYKSRKLRIKQKINLKHFKSVKVYARKMTLSMLENYPVRYDCKLFRLRQKERTDNEIICEKSQNNQSYDSDQSNRLENKECDSVSTDRLHMSGHSELEPASKDAEDGVNVISTGNKTDNASDRENFIKTSESTTKSTHRRKRIELSDSSENESACKVTKDSDKQLKHDSKRRKSTIIDDDSNHSEDRNKSKENNEFEKPVKLVSRRESTAIHNDNDSVSKKQSMDKNDSEIPAKFNSKGRKSTVIDDDSDDSESKNRSKENTDSDKPTKFDSKTRKSTVIDDDSDDSESKNTSKENKDSDKPTKFDSKTRKSTVIDDDSDDSESKNTSKENKDSDKPTKFDSKTRKSTVIDDDSDDSESKNTSKENKDSDIPTKFDSKTRKSTVIDDDSDDSESKNTSKENKDSDKPTKFDSKTRKSTVIDDDSDDSESKNTSKENKDSDKPTKFDSKTRKSTVIDDDSDDSESKNTSKENKDSDKPTKFDSKTRKSTVIDDDSDDSESKNTSKENKDSDKPTKFDSKTRKSTVIDDDSDDSESKNTSKENKDSDKPTKFDSKTRKSTVIDDDSDDSESKNTSKENKDSDKPDKFDSRRKKSTIIDDDSDDSESKNKSSETVMHGFEKRKLTLTNDDSDKPVKLVSKQRKSTIDDDNSDGVVEISSSKSDNDSIKDTNEKNETKPMIKCVSLCKLLKPDVLQQESKMENKASPSKPQNEKTTKLKDNRSNSLVKQREKREYIKAQLENDYWEQKRREVKAFKPKQFSINIIKGLRFSVENFKEHNIKKITQNGQVVFNVEVNCTEREIDVLKLIENVEKSTNNMDSEILSEARRTKRALLAQSDSESDGSAKIAKSKTAKKALLSKSDSGEESEPLDKSHNEQSTTNKNTPIESETILEENTDKTDCEGAKKRLLDGSDSDDGANETPDKNSDHESVKSKKKCSDKESNKCPKNSKKPSPNQSADEKTEDKNEKESTHAKKMLLRYSSSDDEQLKKNIEKIKDSLLKEASDEDNKKSSSSEEDFRKSKIKKKHKRKTRRKVSSSSSDDSKTIKKKMVRSKSKPGNCSSQNSDAQDPSDKDIDRLTTLSTLNKKRRRSNDSEHTRTKSEIIEKPVELGEYFETNELIDNEVILGGDSSENESVGDNNEPGDDGDDDLPAVQTLNGDPIVHLAREDLLGESDSSVSHNEKRSSKEDTDEDAKLNSKRRKAIAISSDSEAGSSRKKDKDVRLSDFEDSDDSEPAKKSKRKKKETDSDASASSNEGKKKRRRIKQINDSEGSGSETETEGRNKHGRKNIRKVMGKNQLEEATKKAARQEKERIARITERQKLYNNLEFDESGKPDEVVLEKVILDFDPETKEPLIQVDRGLVKKLKPHQANGIKFMWDACFESAKRIKKDKGSGCILAHCMGLGKTLQVVSLTHTLLTHRSLTKVNRVLVVCPLSTVLNWVNEFRMWLKHAETDYEVDVYELSRFKQNSERAFQLSQWFVHGGVCVLGYEMFRNLSADNSKKFKKKMLKNFQESLVDPGPDLVVCDEGHLLKNEKTSLSQSMNRVRTLRRIVLTGTPLQNNLKEYYCMVQFVKPNLLGKYNEYLNRFVNPITNGQYTDSTEHDIKVMKRRSHVLHKMLDGAVQRRDYGVLAPFLPPKHEYVLFITLSEVQVKLYQFYLDNFSRRPLPGKSSGFLFPDFQSLQRIWTHPLVLKYNSERYEIMQQKKREREEEDSEGSLVDFIDDDSTPEESSTEESSDDMSDVSDDSRKKSKKKKAAKKNKAKDSKVSTRRGTRANPIDHEDDDKDDDILEVKNENPTEWWIKLVSDDEVEDMRNSHKLVLLFDILRQCETIGDKLLVFSQSLYSLDLIEHFLGKVDEATQEGRIDEKLGGHVGSWSPGVDYFRLDGSTSCENRSIWCKNFNREDNPRARLFLISTRAGGLGINLVAANRVVIFDVSWNPSHDVQSIFRVYRFGQKKPCYIYRFLAMGTMEEKIYERQVTKQAISKRVIDEQQIDRHYAENDLAELYKFEASPPMPREIPPLPKDRLFAEMLKEHEAQIYKYHEHDSLLENKEEETLSEEERKAAWEDFENEKNRPPPAPFPSAWPMHNGMNPGLLAQQQQQLAYAAIASLRKEMPNISDQQLKEMLPLIYNAANPAMFGGYDYGMLMQKMNEMYKFSSSMMTPGMMNAMNPASGGSGMGGSSGLHYEPPWLRQQRQQQQQQLRVQQMLQQQNMGAKMYAGGLGSRDPVAMALQQQRAREIMLGGARPRGRPPLHPPAHDIVNLDSD